MSDKKNSDPFSTFLKNVVPIKKTDKITKPIPKKRFVDKFKIKSELNLTTNKNEKTKTTTKIKRLTIEKSNINKKLKKGTLSIDKRIDFHGCTTGEAREIFVNTINNCFMQKQRCVLFITGKGIKKYGDSSAPSHKLYFGKIRNDFLNWIYSEEVQNKILSVQQAGQKHGGDGAFFVYLRKNKN